MSKPVAIFFHCMVSPLALPIIAEQMAMIKASGLGAEAKHFLIGLNATPATGTKAASLLLKSASLVWHGDGSKSENLTILEMEKWVSKHPGWNVLYFHTKGATHRPGSPTYPVNTRWRHCMMNNLVAQWKRCVLDLNEVESVGCHWYRGLDKTQNFWAGTFFWATSDFLATLPSITKRAAVIRHGIFSRESRYEAEVWIGNGSRLPTRKDYHPGFKFNCPP